MVPYYGPLPSLKGSEVWVLGLYRSGVYKGPVFRAHTKDHETTPRLRGQSLDHRSCLRKGHRHGGTLYYKRISEARILGPEPQTIQNIQEQWPP